MSITLDVSLLSGKSVSVETGLSNDVNTLKGHAQRALGVGNGRLLGPSGLVLDGARTILECGLEAGDGLTLQVQPAVAVMAAASEYVYSDGAYAAILGDGSVVTWGEASCGGDSTAVQNRLSNVQQIHASRKAFAAILADGSVVAWGDAKYGGDSSAVQDQLSHVQQIQVVMRLLLPFLPMDLL